MSDNGTEPLAEPRDSSNAPQQGESQGGSDRDGGEEKYKIFVRGNGVGTTVDKGLLESTFNRFGEIKSVWTAGGGRGYCFIEFARRDDAEAAVREMNGQELNGVRLDVELARRTTPGGRAGEFGTKPGDWACPNCRVNNFARRDRCFRCGAAKPYGGGGGGYDRDDRRRGRGRSRDRDDRRYQYDDRRGGYEDRRGGYDDRRSGYDERRGAGGGGGSGGYDRGGNDRQYDRGGYDRGYDRGVDDRRAGGPPPPAPPRYEERGRGRSKSR